MAKKKSIHIRKSYQILLMLLVLFWILQVFGIFSVAPYAVAIVLTILVAVIWG